MDSAGTLDSFLLEHILTCLDSLIFGMLHLGNMLLSVTWEMRAELAVLGGGEISPHPYNFNK